MSKVIRNLMASGEFAVMVNTRIDGSLHQLSIQTGMTFTEAADFSIHATNYFKFAILEHAEWESVEIEIGARVGTIQLIEVKND